MPVRGEYPTARELTEKIGGKWNERMHRGNGPCPAHDDASPSLDITERNGTTLLICRAGCSQERVIDALRAKGLWPERRANGKANGHAVPSRIVATHDYHDADGILRFQAVRYGPKKSFRQRRPDPSGKGWVWTQPIYEPHRYLPFRLPDLLEDIALGKPVFVVEGEKDAENARSKLGIAATCNACGAGKWDARHAAYLKDADAIIVPDNDDAGRSHAEDVAVSLQGIAKRVRVLVLPGLPTKGDLSDWIDAGGTAEQIWALAEKAPEWKPPAPEDEDADLAMLNAKYAVVKVGGKTRIVSLEEAFSHPGCKVPVYSSITDFCAFHAHPKKVVINENTGRPRKVGIGSWWVAHEKRRQYDCIVYAPDADPEAMHGKLNLWSGFGCEQIEGNCSKYLEHLRTNICSGVEDHYEYLLGWMARAVQHPGRQGEVAVVLRGKEGTGKGVAIGQFGRLFGSHYRHISQAGHLTGHFNAHLQHCSILFADEAFFAGDRSHESILKALITEDTLIIEPKGVDAFPVKNCLHLMMSSNSDWVVPAGADARRYFVLSVADTKKQDHTYFAAIVQEMDNGGREALLYLLLNRDLSGFNLRNVPQTGALAEQKAHSRRGIDRLVELLAYRGFLPAVHQMYLNVAVTAGEDDGKGFYPAARRLVPDLKHLSSRHLQRAEESMGLREMEER